MKFYFCLEKKWSGLAGLVATALQEYLLYILVLGAVQESGITYKCFICNCEMLYKVCIHQWVYLGYVASLLLLKRVLNNRTAVIIQTVGRETVSIGAMSQ